MSPTPAPDGPIRVLLVDDDDDDYVFTRDVAAAIPGGRIRSTAWTLSTPPWRFSGMSATTST
jgi:hypothetical protein